MIYQLIVPIIVGSIAVHTGIARDASVDLTALAQQRVAEYSAGQDGHRYLEELNNGKWASWGEVLGWNQFYPNESDSAEAVVDGWMESPTHREILVNPQYDQIGCAVEKLPDAEYFYVCIVGDSVESDIGKPSTRHNPAYDPSAALPDTAMETPR